MFSQNTSLRHLNIGLAMLRLVLGTIFIAHGAQKLFVYGLDGIAGGFSQMGVPLASVAGPLVAFVEFFGGIALIIGLLTRLASGGLVVVMLGALLIVHLKAGFFMPNGYEFVLALAASTLFLLISGAGAYSIDAFIARKRGDPSAAAAAVVKQTQRAA